MKSLKNDINLEEKWGKIGLLEDANNPKNMAFCLECAAKMLCESEISEHNGMIIPIVFRVINGINPTNKRESRKIIKDVLETFPSFLLNNKDIISNLISFSTIDWEAEMCALFTEEYLRPYENNRTIR